MRENSGNGSVQHMLLVQGVQTMHAVQNMLQKFQFPGIQRKQKCQFQGNQRK